MSMDNVFYPNARKWVSPLILLKGRIKEMQITRQQFLGHIDDLYQYIVEIRSERMKMIESGEKVSSNFDDDGDQTPPMTKEEREADNLRRQLIFGKPKKERKKRGKGKQKGESDPEDTTTNNKDDFDILAMMEEDEEDMFNNHVQSDPEDYIDMQDSSDDDDAQMIRFDSDSSSSSSEEDEEFPNVESDGEMSDEAFKKLQEKYQPNAAAMAGQDEQNFANHYKYCLRLARTRDRRSYDKEQRNHQLFFGFDSEKIKSIWYLASVHLATTKAEVIVDDAIFRNTEMPLLAGAIPPLAVKKLSSLAIYTTLSDEPGNFQWRMVNVVDQLTNDLKFSKQNLRTRQLGKLLPPDLVSSDPDDCIMTVTMYQAFEVPEGDYFYDLKTSQEPKVGLVIEILGSQTLQDLLDKLRCQSDYMCTTEMSDTFSINNADDLLAQLHGDLSGGQYTSRIIFVNDTLFSDNGQMTNKYFDKLNAWVKQAPKKEIKSFKKGRLSKKLRDLKLRFGFPYMYLHQGTCEHIIVFNGFRTARRVDYQEFPRYERIGKYPTKYCRVDNESLARWAVVNYNRVPEDPMLLCTDCVNHYCFKGTERVGEFKLFPFLQFLHYM